MEAPFLKAKEIINTLHAKGFEAYFVGGSVRDFLLHRTIGDIDIATSALPSDIMTIFQKTIDVGAAHGTVIVLYNNEQYEVTTFRTEGRYEDFRRPSEVEFITSLHEDLRRRDFTMNAIAMTMNGELIDPFNGTGALQNRIIQTVGDAEERFNEDALRMMRAIRFVSQLEFSLSEETKLAIKKNAHLLRNISVERITIEFEKILKGPFYQKALPLFLETSLYQYVPGLQNELLHLQKFKQYNWDRLRMRAEYWTLVCYLLKVDNSQAFLRKWKLPNKLIKSITQNLFCLSQVKSSGWTKRLLYESEPTSIEQAERLCSVVGLSTSAAGLTKQYRDLPIKSRRDLAVSGEDLLKWFDKAPGKWISDTLELIENGILENAVKNDVAQIKEWLKSCK